MLCLDKEKLKFEASVCLLNTDLPWRNPASGVKVWVKIDTNIHAIYGTPNNYLQKYGLLIVRLHAFFRRRSQNVLLLIFFPCRNTFMNKPQHVHKINI